MARDPSPFAKRLKAFTNRAGREDEQPGSSAEFVEPTAPPAGDDTPADEQPTGEFPAIDEPRAAGDFAEPADTLPEHHGTPPAVDGSEDSSGGGDSADAVSGGPVPDAPLEPAPAGDEDQPTLSSPAVDPAWLDPAPADPGLGASSSATPDEGVPGTDRVDWESPADDVLDLPATPTPPGDGVSPYLPDAAGGERPASTDVWGAGAPASDTTPAWEAEAQAADEPPAPSPLGIWDTPEHAADDAPSGEASSGDAAAPADDSAPAWAAEAESLPSAGGPVVPPPLSGYDRPAADPAPRSDGPTLSPPVLPKKGEPTSGADAGDDSAAPSGPDESALSALPDEREPEWTPTALHEALSLDDDETQAAGSPSGESAGDADTTDTTDETEASPASDDGSETGDELPSADADGQATQVSDAVPAPPAKRGFLGGLRRRRGAADAPSTPQPDDASAEDAAAADAAAVGSTAYGTAPERADETAASAPEPAASTADQPTTPVVTPASPADDAELRRDEDASAEAAPTVDPGSITSRFAAIGRRALARKARDEQAAAAEAPIATSEEPAQPAEPAGTVVVVESDPLDPAVKPSFSERAALRRRVKSLRARRDAGLAELGAIVLDQSRFGDPTGGTLLRRRTSALADLDGEIAAIEAALEDRAPAEAVAQLGTLHCTSCSALVGPADRFCANCGTSRPSADADDLTPAP